jgi:hypothetical protein
MKQHKKWLSFGSGALVIVASVLTVDCTSSDKNPAPAAAGASSGGAGGGSAGSNSAAGAAGEPSGMAGSETAMAGSDESSGGSGGGVEAMGGEAGEPAVPPVQVMPACIPFDNTVVPANVPPL